MENKTVEKDDHGKRIQWNSGTIESDLKKNGHVKLPSGRRLSRDDVRAEVTHSVKYVEETPNKERKRSMRRSILAPFSTANRDSEYAVHSQIQSSVATKDNSMKVNKKKGKEPPTILEGKKMQFAMGTGVFVALFAPDFWTLFIPQEYDSVLTVILTLTFLIFLVEIVLGSLYRKGYRWSFYFALDFVAMLSLLLDIPYFWDAIVSTNSPSQDNLAIFRMGRLARTGTRTTRALRILRYARYVRVFVFITLLRTYFTTHYLKRVTDSATENPNKLGVKLADLLGKRVLLGSLILLVVVPYLDVQEIDYSKDQGLEILEFLNVSGAGMKAQITATDKFLSLNPDIFILNVVNQTILNQTTGTGLRDDFKITILSNSEDSFLVFDFSDVAKKQAGLNICLTFVLMIYFALSAYLFNRDVHNIVVRPIIKTTRVIRRLAKTLFLLSNDHEEDDETEFMESEFVETIVDQLVTFFNVDGKTSGAAGKNVSSVFPSKTNSGLLKSILENEDDQVLVKRDSQIGSDVADSAITVLNSFNEFWNDKQARQYFKVFLTAEFAVESLLFVDDVDHYNNLWKELCNHHWEIIHKYVDEKAPFQVNISDFYRNTLLNHDGKSFGLDLYSDSREELLKQLERDNFSRFKKSNLAQRLISVKKANIARERERGEGYNSQASSSVVVVSETGRIVSSKMGGRGSTNNSIEA